MGRRARWILASGRARVCDNAFLTLRDTFLGLVCLSVCVLCDALGGRKMESLNTVLITLPFS